jgi:hypothetical protein
METWIVSSHFKENIDWLKNINFPVVIVSKNQNYKDESFLGFHNIPNKGLEFGSYLWFICKYWDDMPEKVAFIHGHETSHHQSLSITDAITEYKDFEFHGLNGPRYSACHYFENLCHPWFGNSFYEIWSFLDLTQVREAPSEVVCQGGTQCIISRNLIRSRPRSFYEEIFDKINKHPDDKILALVLELAWHIIFGLSPVDNSLVVKEFDEYCKNNKESILLTSPKQIWCSSMKSTVKFDHVESDSEWISICMEALALFGKRKND